MSLRVVCSPLFFAASIIPCVNAATPYLDKTIISAGALEEERATGTYGQPEWTTSRRFSLTRIYVQKDPGEYGIEGWYRFRSFDGGRNTQRYIQEFEIGLPYRMQLDLYEKVSRDSDVGEWEQDEFAVELRYALADWGKIWGNPTTYFEYAFTNGGPDVLETKLLLGDDYQGWHWGGNLINEHELWGERKNEWGVSGGVSRVIVDSVFSIGLETKWTFADGEKSELILGPSIQWLPSENTHVNFVALAGLNDASPNVEVWCIVGFDFGSLSKKKGGYKPTTLSGL